MFFYEKCSLSLFLDPSKFLYYMFDRQWTVPDEEWRHIIDDFAATFGVTRHSLLESFTFFLLDDEGALALKVRMEVLFNNSC